jgi:hypothetical protein
MQTFKTLLQKWYHWVSKCTLAPMVKTAVIDPHSRRKEEEIDTYVIGHVNAKTISAFASENATSFSWLF